MTGSILVSTVAGFIASLVAYGAGATFIEMVFLFALVAGMAFIATAGLAFIIGGAKRLMGDDIPSHYRTTVDQIKRSKPLRLGTGLSPASTLKILAVDDDPLILDLVSMIAPSQAGFDVTSVLSGEAALKYLAQKDVVFDCFLLDIDMPNMNGIALCGAIRKMPGYIQTPIIMLTAARDAHNMAEAFKAGATTYTTKPFDVEEFVMRLQFVYEMKLSGVAGSAASDAPPPLAKHTRSPRKPSLGAPVPVPNSLVDNSVIVNFLSQIPPQIAPEIQIFGVTFTQLATSARPIPPQQRESFEYNVTLAAKECFDVEVFLIAPFDDDSFVVVTTGVDLSQLPELEAQFERKLAQLNFWNSELNDLSFFTAIGGPLKPQPSLARDSETRILRSVQMARRRAKGIAFGNEGVNGGSS
ncbi:response regulator transcription factor [Loktanella sp. SALINAS62]|uniref:response regulator n=1 Tax=Loktanella sp. SALINAS62 TaxID=2706124 RepID=UPI001B8BC049|nr:response regulator transcription factor [Loktanella sp. SALINAS62]MBS1301523.1 response regulator [Loktanella sp. SALINAS62]